MLRRILSATTLLAVAVAVASCGSGSITALPKQAVGSLEQCYSLSLTPVDTTDDSLHTPSLSMRVNRIDESIICTVFNNEAGAYNFFGCHVTYDASLLSYAETEYADVLGSDSEIITLTVSDRPGFIALGQCTVGLGDKWVSESDKIVRLRFSTEAQRRVLDLPDANQVSESAGLRLRSHADLTNENVCFSWSGEDDPIDPQVLTITWEEANDGDYNNDKQVNQADITPIGMFNLDYLILDENYYIDGQTDERILAERTTQTLSLINVSSIAYSHVYPRPAPVPRLDSAGLGYVAPTDPDDDPDFTQYINVLVGTGAYYLTTINDLTSIGRFYGNTVWGYQIVLLSPLPNAGGYYTVLAEGPELKRPHWSYKVTGGQTGYRQTLLELGFADGKDPWQVRDKTYNDWYAEQPERDMVQPEERQRVLYKRTIDLADYPELEGQQVRIGVRPILTNHAFGQEAGFDGYGRPTVFTGDADIFTVPSIAYPPAPTWPAGVGIDDAETITQPEYPYDSSGFWVTWHQADVAPAFAADWEVRYALYYWSDEETPWAMDDGPSVPLPAAKYYPKNPEFGSENGYTRVFDLLHSGDYPAQRFEVPPNDKYDDKTLNLGVRAYTVLKGHEEMRGPSEMNTISVPIEPDCEFDDVTPPHFRGFATDEKSYNLYNAGALHLVYILTDSQWPIEGDFVKPEEEEAFLAIPFAAEHPRSWTAAGCPPCESGVYWGPASFAMLDVDLADLKDFLLPNTPREDEYLELRVEIFRIDTDLEQWLVDVSLHDDPIDWLFNDHPLKDWWLSAYHNIALTYSSNPGNGYFNDQLFLQDLDLNEYAMRGNVLHVALSPPFHWIEESWTNPNRTYDYGEWQYYDRPLYPWPLTMRKYMPADFEQWMEMSPSVEFEPPPPPLPAPYACGYDDMRFVYAPWIEITDGSRDGHLYNYVAYTAVNDASNNCTYDSVEPFTAVFLGNVAKPKMEWTGPDTYTVYDYKWMTYSQYETDVDIYGGKVMLVGDKVEDKAASCLITDATAHQVRFPAIAYDSVNDRIGVSYYCGGEDAAVLQEFSLGTEVISINKVDTAHYGDTSLKYDANGDAHVMYFSVEAEDPTADPDDPIKEGSSKLASDEGYFFYDTIYYRHRAGQTWQDREVVECSSIVARNEHNLHIAGVDTPIAIVPVWGEELQLGLPGYAVQDTPSWDIGAINVGYEPTAYHLDSVSVGGITYVVAYFPTGPLLLAEGSGDNWAVHEVEADDVGGYPSVVAFDGGNLGIAYMYGTERKLKYIEWDTTANCVIAGSEFTSMWPDSGYQTAVCVSFEGEPVVFSLRRGVHALWFAERTDDGWLEFSYDLALTADPYLEANTVSAVRGGDYIYLAWIRVDGTLGIGGFWR